MQLPTNFTVLPSSQKGDVYATEFAFSSNLPSNYTAFAWSFGDNVIEYNKSSVTHTYNYPGIYTVGLSAWTDQGVMYADAATIDVDYVYRDAILFGSIPKSYGTPGLRSDEPFTVSITSAKIDQPLSIVLQSFYSKSVPHYAVPEKWNFITPKWRFEDQAGNILDGPLPLSTTPIYKDSKIVAVKAESSFYYVDDLSTGTDPNKECPLLLVATLSTEGFSYPLESQIYPYTSYSNSEVARAAIAWQINDIVPTKLIVTENFLNDVYPVKWANVPIPVMITCQTDTTDLSSFDETGGYVTNALSYPRTNELGALHPVTLELRLNGNPLPVDYYKVNESPLYFKATDEYDNVASGYIFTTITPLSPIDGNLTIVANTTASNQVGTTNSFAFPVGYPIHPEVYVSHPSKSTINRINIVTYSTAVTAQSGEETSASNGCPAIDHYKNLGILVEGAISTISVPTLTSTDLINYTLSGNAGVYAMSFNPVKNKLYTSDVDQNIISIYDSGTTLTKSIQLSTVFNNETLCPSYISIDSTGHVWVSLFDSYEIIKLDSNLNYLLSAAPSNVEISLLSLDGELGFVLQENSGYLQLDQQTVSVALLSPPIVETDMNDDVWVCYPDAMNSLLVKFDSNGSELFKVESLPGNSMPISLAINATNGIWVACKLTDSIMCFDADGTLVDSVSGFLRPSYIAMDRSNNVWVAHGYDFCSVYNTTTLEIKTWRISSNPEEVARIYSYTPTDIQKPLDEDEIWGGLATDVYDRVWIIDSLNNTVFLFGANDPTNYRTYKVAPYADTMYIYNTGDAYVTDLPSDLVKSAQAGGDWTGNRWYQKYSGGYKSAKIQGTSASFKVYDIDKSFKIAKVNEEFDCSAYYKSLALPEILNRNTDLFDSFFAAVVGDGNPTQESAGRVSYEKIANFVSNRGDFETAEIDELLSMAESMAVDTKTFGKGFPVAINRLLNLFSVPKQQLRGVPNLETDLMNNIGPILTQTSLITADQYYYIKDRKYGTYQLVYTNTLSGLTTYPIDKLEVEGLRQPITDNYYLFTQNLSSYGYSGNLINWHSDYTDFGRTNSYTLSTNEEWYGDNGLVETMFNNLLTKQLYVE